MWSVSIDSRRRAELLMALAAFEAVAAVVGVLVAGITYQTTRDSFAIPNWVIGSSCAACGGLIAWNRPRNRLGWFLLGAGITQAGTAAVTPWLIHALQDGGPVKLLSTLYSAAWPLSVSLFIPLAVLYFPDGKLPGRLSAVAVIVAIVNAPVQVLLFSADPNPLPTVPGLGLETSDRAESWLSISFFAGHPGLQLASDVALGLVLLTGVAGLAVRYRRGTEKARRQLLWLLLAATIAVGLIASSRLGGPVEDTGFPIILLTLIALIPISMAIAVLRYQLFDIRLVWARTVTYVLLTAAVAATYLLVVEVADRLLRGVGASVLATLVVAVGFNPVRVRLQRQVDRLLYGERADPVRAAASVTARLADAAEQPADVLPAVCHALRLPYAALSGAAGLLGEYGVRPERVETVMLRHAGEQVGELTVGVRSGEKQLGAADRAVLDLMAVPIGVALRAQALSEAVQLSRREIVGTREEERRRLRRDLHDGLGPMLTGLGFRADAVVNLADDADRVRSLGADIREGIDAAIVDVRRLIYRLQPTALDEVGLVEAVRRHAQLLDRRVDGMPLEVTVESGPALPRLPAAVEVAAYRIVTEALTNVARHSGATRVEVRIDEDEPGELALTVSDDGPAVNGAWVPGVGLRSMLERVTELGGRMLAEPTPSGGRVHADLPFGVIR
jgi:two-component system NarL family sensor kinase